jgi:hypothetical protein
MEQNLITDYSCIQSMLLYMKWRNIPWVISTCKPAGILRHWGGAVDPQGQMVSNKNLCCMARTSWTLYQISHLMGSTKRDVNQINRPASGNKVQQLDVTSSLAQCYKTCWLSYVCRCGEQKLFLVDSRQRLQIVTRPRTIWTLKQFDECGFLSTRSE